jgi:hypothetical protein
MGEVLANGAVAVVSVFLGWFLARGSREQRQRSGIREELEIWERLPPGEERDALKRRIDRQMRLYSKDEWRPPSPRPPATESPPKVDQPSRPEVVTPYTQPEAGRPEAIVFLPDAIRAPKATWLRPIVALMLGATTAVVIAWTTTRVEEVHSGETLSGAWPLAVVALLALGVGAVARRWWERRKRGNPPRSR